MSTLKPTPTAPGIGPQPRPQSRAANYYAHARPEMLAYFERSPGRVLDVGCGQGSFGAALKAKHPNAEVWGVEPIPAAARSAAEVLDRVCIGHFDAALGLLESSFDTVVFNDSLEHFPDPAPALALALQLLKSGGQLVASIPNVRHWPHLKRYLFQGDWKYEDEGILDRTHLRFFTCRSIRRTLAEAGFDVQTIQGIGPCWRGLRLGLAKALLPRVAQDILYLQFAVVANPRPLPARAEASP